MKKLLSGVLVLFLAFQFGTVSAQQMKREGMGTSHWSLGLKGGMSNFGFNKSYDEGWKSAWNGGLVLDYSINPIFGFGLDAGYYNYNDNSNSDNAVEFQNHVIDALVYGSVNLTNLLAPVRTWKTVNVYGIAGGGVGFYSYNVDGENSDFTGAGLLAAGLSLEVNLGKMWAVGVGGDARLHLKDDLNGEDLNKSIKSINGYLTVKYKFNSVKKDHVRNMSTDEYFPVVVPAMDDARLNALEAQIAANRSVPSEQVTRLENEVSANRQKIQQLEQTLANSKDQLQRSQEQIRDLRNQEVTVANLVVENIEFRNGQRDLTAGNKAILDQVAAILTNNMRAWKSLEISGYTDATGPESGNLRLSETRAKLVAGYLMQKGIPEDRISSIKGYGSLNPIAPNTTVEGRNTNRRVEVHINK